MASGKIDQIASKSHDNGPKTTPSPTNKLCGHILPGVLQEALKILILVLSLISSPVLAQTLTTDAASGNQLAKELQFCSAYFIFISQCYADKDFTRRLGTQDKKLSRKLARIYENQALLAAKNSFKIAQANNMSSADFTAGVAGSTKMVGEALAGNCANINILLDKYGPLCKRLVDEPLLRLKELSECPNEGKVGC